MYEEVEQSAEFATLKEDIDWIITDVCKDLKEQVVKAIKLDIVLIEQELRDNYTEAIRLINRGLVINQNFNTNTDTVATDLINSYHEILLNNNSMD